MWIADLILLWVLVIVVLGPFIGYMIKWADGRDTSDKGELRDNEHKTDRSTYKL